MEPLILKCQHISRASLKDQFPPHIANETVNAAPNIIVSFYILLQVLQLFDVNQETEFGLFLSESGRSVF